MDVDLFVYGSLQYGFDNEWSRRIWMSAKPQAARVRGRLYLISTYPGLKPAERADEWVHGQLVKAGGLLADLDSYEGPEYFRKRCRATVAGNVQVTVWAYFYLGEVAEERRIVSGRFTKSGRDEDRPA